MNLTDNLILNIYSILLLIIISIHASKHYEKVFFPHKLYMVMLYTSILMLVLDTFSRFDGNPDTYYAQFNYLGNLLVFLLNPVIPSLWLMYAHFQVYHEENRTKRLLYPLLFLNAINMVLTVLSQYWGWFYYIDRANIYHRGHFFWVPASFTITLILSAFLLIIFNRKRIEKKHYFSLVFFAVPPFACVILQILFYGVSLMLNGLSLSLLIVFFTIQNRRIDTDYLTGVYNRKSLDAYMRKKINMCTGNNTFSAILIDLNDFKSINDTFGHDMGDEALQASVRLLKGCIRSNDFIARYGGDEFYIILDVSDQAILDETVARIHRCLEKYNMDTAKPFPLYVSMGYAVYNCRSNMEVEEFQKHIDLLMYENKRANKGFEIKSYAE